MVANAIGTEPRDLINSRLMIVMYAIVERREERVEPVCKYQIRPERVNAGWYSQILRQETSFSYSTDLKQRNGLYPICGKYTHCYIHKKEQAESNSI